MYYQTPVPSPITLRVPIGADQRRQKYKIPKFDNLKFKMMDDVITLGQFGYIILDRKIS